MVLFVFVLCLLRDLRVRCLTFVFVVWCLYVFVIASCWVVVVLALYTLVVLCC